MKNDDNEMTLEKGDGHFTMYNHGNLSVRMGDDVKTIDLQINAFGEMTLDVTQHERGDFKYVRVTPRKPKNMLISVADRDNPSGVISNTGLNKVEYIEFAVGASKPGEGVEKDDV